MASVAQTEYVSALLSQATSTTANAPGAEPWVAPSPT